MPFPVVRINLEEFAARYSDSGQSQILSVLRDQHLPQLSPQGPWLAGGAIRRVVMGETTIKSDFDLFFRDAAQFEAAHVAMLEMGFRAVRGNESNVVFIREVEFNGDKVKLIVQLIRIRFYESPEALLDEFDFTICQFAYDGNEMICSAYALWDVSRRRISVHRISFAVASVRRLMKYSKQGFTVCGGAIRELLGQVIQRPETAGGTMLYID